MARDRLATQELEGVLALLDEVSQASARSVSAPTHEPQPPKITTARRRSGAVPSKLFAPVRVEGDDQLGRAASEDKIAILRRKVRALEDRFEDIREAWSERDADLDQAKQEARRHEQRRENAEESMRTLNAFVREKKKEIEAYQGRVQEALREQARREQTLQERVAQAELAEREARDSVERVERAGREALERVQRAERAERAEREALERERRISTPPPPPLLTRSDIEELADNVTAAGRSISNLLKGRIEESEQREALRTAMRLLKSSHELLAAVLLDMQ